MWQDNKHGEQTNRPEYGERKQPEYGAMKSQYPEGYDPYRFGAPEPEESAGQAQVDQVAQSDQANQANTGYTQNPYATNNQQPPQEYANVQFVPIDKINMDDPAQNPWYGKWDFFAILSFIALWTPWVLLPFVFSIVSLWRTKKLRMRGRGLAIFSLVVSIIAGIGAVWLSMHGISYEDLYAMILQQVQGSSGGTIQALL